MNLAWKDVRRQGPRFLLTAVGLGLLYAIVLAMGGIYRGLVDDATMLVDRMGASLWVVQRDTRGPFAERSLVPSRVADRARAIDGVADARPFVFATVQREHDGVALRVSIVGLSWPEDTGAAMPLVEGRALRSAHRELIADRSLGLALGEAIELGGERYTVVGRTGGLVSSGGDGIAFVTIPDALAILAHAAPAAVRADRDAREARWSRGMLSRTVVRSAPDATGVALVTGPQPVNAVLVYLREGRDVESVRRALERSGDVTAYTTDEQRALLVHGVVEKSRQQIGLFRGLLIIVAMIIVALILYNMTTARTREIALLKLMGARTRVIVGMIMQQAIMLGVIGYSFAMVVAAVAFPHFPRRVVLPPAEIALVGVLVVAITVLSSVAGIAKAMSIPATTILSG